MKYTQVSSNREFLETLEEMAEPPRQAEPGESAAGRPNELKTFILESDKELPLSADLGDVSYDIASTGMEAIEVMRNPPKSEFCAAGNAQRINFSRLLV